MNADLKRIACLRVREAVVWSAEKLPSPFYAIETIAPTCYAMKYSIDILHGLSRKRNDRGELRLR